MNLLINLFNITSDGKMILKRTMVPFASYLDDFLFSYMV